MGIVNQAVKDAVRHPSDPDLLVPTRHWHLQSYPIDLIEGSDGNLYGVTEALS